LKLKKLCKFEFRLYFNYYFTFSQVLEEINKNNKFETETETTNLNRYNIRIINKENSIKTIELDIERTFPDLGLFKDGNPMTDDLREILQAFVTSRPDIGYVQGLSYIAGMLLFYMDKFQAFVALMNIVLNLNTLPFYRFDESQIRKRIILFKQLFFHNLPDLCDHFESESILPECYFVEWMMTLFAKNINIDIAARIWDLYMLEGIKSIYQAAIGKPL